METLDKTFLEDKKKSITAKFEKVQKQIRDIEAEEQGLAQRKSGLNVEVFRLQGEFRLVESLLKPGEVVPPEKTVNQ